MEAKGQRDGMGDPWRFGSAQRGGVGGYPGG